MIKYLETGKKLRAGLIALLMVPAGAAQGVMLLPGGDIYSNGDFDEVEYGTTGLAYVKPYLFVGDLAATDKPDIQAAVTNLDYAYQISGFGTSMLQVSYSITNNDPAPFTDLRFMVDVQADGSDSYNDSAKVQWPAKTAGGPDNYQVVDWISDDLPTLIVANNGLNDSDTCGPVCDVDFGLQWNIASIAPGEVWQIVIGLSDDGSALSDRYLQATSVDTSDTVLTVSGNATVVPLPASVFLFASGLFGLLSVSRRLRQK